MRRRGFNPEFIGALTFAVTVGAGSLSQGTPQIMKKISLIEDDADLFSLLKYNLEKEGFALSWTADR